MDNCENLFSFIRKSPTAFHAVKNISEILLSNGFERLLESERWNLMGGKKYFVVRNDSSIIAFACPKNFSSPAGFKIVASHSDSPCFKVKENPEIESGDMVVLNVEKYGGMLMNPWFDRPLSVAGRICVKKDGKIERILFDIERPLLMIPNLAIHFNRDANDGHKIKVQEELRPVFSIDKEKKLISVVAECAGVNDDEILSHDMFLYAREEPVSWGAENEFLSSPRLDDLECAYCTLIGFLNGLKSQLSESKSEAESQIAVYCVFDNEEVGSSTMQGANSSFLSDTLSRIGEKFGCSVEDYKIAISKSFMISADNAHALHPNYASVSDPINSPKINGGIVIKFNAAQKYTTDAPSSALFKEICKKAGVPFQIFTNNSDIAGGSTLGNISQSQVSIRCVDIGLAQWAMHSPYETAGSKDVDFLIKALKNYFS